MFADDGTNSISAAKLRMVMTTRGEILTEQEVEEMIEEADLDGDGSIDCEGNSN